MDGRQLRADKLSTGTDADDSILFNDLLPPNNVDPDNDTRLRFSASLQEDVFEELEDFMQLARKGMFADALEFFDETLKHHLKIFPVFAEYLECLYDQSQTNLYDQTQTSQILQLLHQHHRLVFAEEEKEFLDLFEELMNAAPPRTLEKSLARARVWLRKHFVHERNPTDTEILTSETCLRVLTLCKARRRPLLFDDDYLAPVHAKEPGVWGGWKTWCLQLWEDEKLWEAQHIFSHLVPRLSEDEVRHMYQQFTREPKQPNHRDTFHSDRQNKVPLGQDNSPGLDVVDSEEADRTTSTRLTLNNLGNPNEDIRSLVHLALFNSILDPLHDPAVPFIFLKKGKANPRKGLIKEVRSKALEVCKKAGLEPNCRQVLEYLATQALVDAQNTNDRGDCVGKLGELQTFLIKSKANSDYILESRCHQYISKIKEFIAEADKEEQLAQAQTKEAREKKEKERRDRADSSRGASLALMEKLSEASRSMTSPSSVKDPAVRDLLFQSLSGSIHHFPSPHAWEDQQLYFLLPDRFSDGNEDSSLDLDGQPVRGSTRPFTPSDSGNAVATPVDARTWEESGTIFQGGTLKGIKSKLGYLKRLGITALWVGPIFKQAPHDNHSYHGYAVQDFLEVDPHFGTGEDLRELVRAAHKEGIYVILDIILNHSGDVFAYKGGGKAWDGRRFDVEGFRDSSGNATLPFRPLSNQDILSNPRDCAIWPAELQMTQTFTCEGAISNWDYEPEYLRGDFHSLKDIDLGSGQLDNFTPSLAFSALCEAYKYWIAYADLDGYRIDTVKHMGDAPTRYLCTTLHEFASSVGKDNFLLVGEVTGGRAFEVVEVTGLDAALGIGNIQEKLWRLPKGYANPAEYFDLFRNATFLKKGTNAWMSNKLVTMIDDHDQVWRGNNQKGRFCSDENGDKLVLAALALNLTSLGIPCIYYGTEQSFDGRGGSDRYIRENMFGGSFGAFRSRNRHFFNESNVIYRECAKICQLRNAHAPLRRGRQYLREISSNGRDFGLPHMIGGRMKSIVAWSRIFADREILCAINTNTESWTNAFVTIDAGLHMMGQILTCIYPGERVDGLNNKTEVIGLNGTAVALSIPPSGFVMYMRIGTVTGSQ